MKAPLGLRNTAVFNSALVDTAVFGKWLLLKYHRNHEDP